MNSTEGEAVQGAQQRSGEHDLVHTLAPRLLLEAVDAIRQASDLIRGDETSPILDRHADDLARIADRLRSAGD